MQATTTHLLEVQLVLQDAPEKPFEHELVYALQRPPRVEHLDSKGGDEF
jgi:hypothetical protein